MAVIFAESFDMSPDNDTITAKLFHSVNSGTNFGVNATGGRFGGGALYIQHTGARNAFIDTDPLNAGGKTTIIFGASIYGVGSSWTGNNDRICEFQDISNNVHGYLTTVASTGQLKFVDAGANEYTTSEQLTPQTWHWIEVKYVINDSAGSVEVRLDQAADESDTVISQTGITTASQEMGAVSACKFIRIGTSGGHGLRWDDIHVLDDSGSANNDFLGDGKMVVLRPESDISTNYVPSTGSDNYALIDETTVSESDYVSTVFSGNRDVYELEDLAGTPDTVDFCFVQTYAAQDVGGTLDLKQGIRSSSSEDQSTTIALSTTSRYYRHFVEADPSTSAAWTRAGVNSSRSTIEAV